MVNFRTKNPSSGKILEGRGMEKVGRYMYSMAILNILRPFGIFIIIWNIIRTFRIFYDHLVHLCSFGTILVSCTKKNLATLGRM
jgi:hypothetical protein